MTAHARIPSSKEQAPHNDVVLSCRVRMARNIAGFSFANRASPAQSQEILNLTKPVLLSNEIAQGMIWVDLNQSTVKDRRLLFERHLISKHLAESEHRRAVAISGDESLSVMVNEEDHLRMQILAPGFQLADIYQRLNTVDDRIESRVDYSFSPRWGYLTACPTNVGTGIRFSVMMHLPALKMTNEIERVRRAAKDLHLAVRGYYGEGSESAGDFYQISNQVTLGRTEEELLAEFQEVIVPQIIQYEHQARKILAERSAPVLDDRIHRALSILRSARLLGAEEAMKLLSRVRLGAYTGRLKGVNLDAVTELFLLVQPGHLKLQAGGADLSPEELRETRANIVRQRLAS
ncbi:MAG: protein arginine kinase [Phycisphaerales bacterium]|nr:protein arginine kinase [Phycisphaerales bacterium]MCI0630175.1 protein arginine kinase [Phycisphaerales bacterium]MCI0674884.1 protein arginine kinase [Phycisphaerales bacterium]